MPLCQWRWTKFGCPGVKFSLWQPTWRCALDLWPRRAADTAVPHLLLSSIHTASRLSFVPTFCPARRLDHQRDIPFHTMPQSTIKAGGKEWRGMKTFGITEFHFPRTHYAEWCSACPQSCWRSACWWEVLNELLVLLCLHTQQFAANLLNCVFLNSWAFPQFCPSDFLPVWVNWPPTPPHVTVTSPQSHCQVNMGTGGTEGLTSMQ